MATDKINNFSIGDNNFESVMLTLDQTFRNKHDCYSFSTTALKAGSVIEINGSLYPVTQDVTLPDMTSNKYLMAVPSSAGTFTLLATSTAPTWSDSKQGFYGTSTTANYKYIAVKEGSTIYKYNDRPFYVGAIYTSALNMSGNITTSGDITCDDITCDDIEANGVDCYTTAPRSILISIGYYTSYTIKKPTTLIASPGRVDIWNGSEYIQWFSVIESTFIGALNPGVYRFYTGNYRFVGAYGTTSMTEVF